MNRIRSGSISRLLVFLASIAGLFFVCSPAAGEECTATVATTPELRVHVPALFLGPNTYSVDLQYLPTSDGSIWFDVVGLGVADGIQCENPARFDPIAGTYEFYVPTVAIGSDQYWAAFRYVPETAAAHPRALAAAKGPKVILYGLEKKGSGIPGTARVPDKLKFASTLHLSVGSDVTFSYDMFVQAEVSLLNFVMGSSQISYGTNGGLLKITEASCSYSGLQADEQCDCTANIHGEGYFSATDLNLFNIDTPNPSVLLRYEMGFPGPTIQVLARCCNAEGCSEVVEADYSDVFRNYYRDLRVPGIEQEASNFLAVGWQYHPNPRSGLYATKSYPAKTISVGEGHVSVTGNTDMSLLESAAR